MDSNSDLEMYVWRTCTQTRCQQPFERHRAVLLGHRILEWSELEQQPTQEEANWCCLDTFDINSEFTLAVCDRTVISRDVHK